jgi:hypothetical protein
MIRRMLPVCLVVLAAAATVAHAQATGTPSFNAPYRAFENHEFGGTFSIPSGVVEWAAEGQYRFGHRKFDIGLRGGVLSFDGGGTDLILGVEGRGRVLEQSESFPLDGAIVVGVGTREFDSWLIPGGLSLGRRVDVEDFSFLPYVQPTVFLSTGNGNTDLNFGLGLGADFNLGNTLDLRTSVGLFDGPEGVSISLVWVH